MPFHVSYWRPAKVVLSLLLLPLSAVAEQAIEEIVVTADFRGRGAADLSASVTVLDQETIERAAVQHFEELIYSIPNLNWSGDGNRARYLQIRGVGELEQYEGAPNPSVGFLIDDIDFSGIGTIATLFDMQQIEVLRGPQGTRYGANALAGLVYTRSADPTDEWSGNVRLSAAEDNTLAGGLAFGGPLVRSGSTRFRISAHRHESDGFRDNPFLGRSDTNGRQETALRGKLHWEAGDDWAFRLAALYADIDDGYDGFAIDNSLTVLSDNPGRDAQESLGGSLRATWSGGQHAEFTSITSYADSDIDFSFDADWGNDDAWAPFTYDYISSSERNRETISQEFRLASKADRANDEVGWLAGLYALRLDESLATDNRGVYDDPVVFFFSDSLDEQFSSRFESLNLAAFGQVEVPMGDDGSVTIGLRVENRTIDYADSEGLTLGPDETMVGGEIAYRHDLSDTITGYASVSRGYKAGGFNLGIVPNAQREFGDEVLWNVEAGVKSSWLDNRLALNAAVFYNERRNQQVRTSTQLNPNDPASFVFLTDNAAKGETLGFEADLRWLVSESVEIFGSVGLLDATFDTYVTPDFDRSGRDQAHAPAYSLAVGGTYRHGSGMFARLDVAARDEFFFDVSHDQKSEAYELVNARLGYESERWTAQLWARNLFDETYAVRGFFFGNEPPDFPDTLYIRQGDPRQVGVTFDLRF